MVALCREAIPGVTITTDVMVGFPGETDREFEEGYGFIRSIQFDGMHVFKYSRRSGTRAARMDGQVREEVKAERSRLLREEAVAGIERLHARHADARAEVVWETEHDGIWRGLTDTNVRVYGAPDRARPGRVTTSQLTGPFRDGLWGESAQVELPLVPVS